MAPPVYSTQFLSNTVFGNHTESYTVPAGYRAVIRDISGVGVAGDTETLIYQIAAADAGIIQRQLPPLLTRQIHWEGRVVLNPGDEISVNVTGAASVSQWTVSGYLLQAP